MFHQSYVKEIKHSASEEFEDAQRMKGRQKNMGQCSKKRQVSI